jgi:hypothetical protein
LDSIEVTGLMHGAKNKMMLTHVFGTFVFVAQKNNMGDNMLYYNKVSYGMVPKNLSAVFF